MGTYTSNIPIWDNETSDLQQLLNAFSSAASLQDIASAYCQGGRNVHTACEILLSNLQGTTSGASFSPKDEKDGQNGSSELSIDFMEKVSFADTSTIVTNQKKGLASMGTVVGVIGKDYARSKPLTKESVEGTKPPKVNIEEFPVYEIPPAIETMHKDTEEFLFKMLGDGFQFDKKIIQEVLGHCGYDVATSMDKLLDISASSLEKSGDAFNLTAEEPLKISSDTCKESGGSSKSRIVPGLKSSERSKDRLNLEKELLGALFTVPQRIEEAPKRTGLAKTYRKRTASGKIVTEPYIDTPAELTTPVATLLGHEEENEENEDSYQALRKSVKEYWTTMKQYYNAAVDAFTKGDNEHANKFIEEGHFFMVKAREADEKSTQKFFEPREEVMSLDLHEYSPKEAIRLLRLHLTSLSGIQDFPYLKIIVEGDTEGTKDGARKRLVRKFLEKESIKWNEERDGRTMVVKLDEIDRKGLSFAQK